MGLMRTALLVGARSKWLDEQFRRRGFARKAVARFMPGEDVKDALRAAEDCRASGRSAILTQLGENVVDRGAATGVIDHYLDVLDRVKARGLDAHVSVKLTQLGLDLDQDLALGGLLKLVRRASEVDNFIWIDMEDSSYVDRTLAIFRRARERFFNVGVCLQSYLFRTPNDLESLVPMAAALRLVKGAYNESHQVAYPRKADVDAQFLSLAMRLLRTDARSEKPLLGFGTHDPRLIELVRQHAQSVEVPSDAFEIQMLYGIARAEQERLTAAGLRVRILISYGAAWFPWYMRRLAERPANVLFALRSAFA